MTAIFYLKSFLLADSTANCVLKLHEEWRRVNWIEVDESCNVLVNTRTRIAMLTLGARWANGRAQTTEYRESLDHTGQDQGRYYRSYSTIAVAVRAFFKKYGDNYHLMIDAANLTHQSGLYIQHHGKRYIFHAFNPNNNANSTAFTNLPKLISKSAEYVDIWSSWSDNEYGHCFALSWFFFHSVMVKNHMPLQNERITGRYYLRRRYYEQVDDTDTKENINSWL